MRINPFESDIVSEPRRVRRAVAGLNEAPLEALIRSFEDLETPSPPRRAALSHTRFVVSPQPGYGKSHLIGRLFRRLSQRGTLVYLRPFEDAATCWKSILLKTVQELDFPDRMDVEYCGAGEPTQLEAFAHGILVHIIASALERDCRSYRRLREIRNHAVADFRKAPRRVAWVAKHFDGLVRYFTGELRRHGIQLNASPRSWLGVLFRYAYRPGDESARETCLDWIGGASVEPEEAAAIGIRRRDIPSPDLPSGETNELCRNRITDLCLLAGFFRPFVFCFDQSENYGKEESLARALGVVIEVLTDACSNQMTVLTANQHAWTGRLRPFWEEAHLNRLSPSLELTGITRGQAERLIRQRFEGLPEAEWKGFLGDGAWLSDLFAESEELGVRDFLQQCAARWRNLSGEAPVETTLEACFKKAVAEIASQPRRLVFDPNILHWLVHEAALLDPGITVERYRSPKGYFPLRWTTEGVTIFIGFEGGSHWKRWQAIEREAKRLSTAEKGARAVVLRTADLQPVPRKNWAIAHVLTAARGVHLDVLHLTKKEMIQLYAAHDLYTDALAGNIPFTPEAVLAFVRERLKPFWKRVRRPSRPRKPGKAAEPEAESDDPERDGRVSQALVAEVREIVRKEKFLSVDDLMGRLSMEATQDQVHRARGRIPEIRVYAGPAMTVLQWQSAP